MHVKVLATIHNDYVPFIDVATNEQLGEFVRAQIHLTQGKKISVEQLSSIAKALLDTHSALLQRLEDSKAKKKKAGEESARRRTEKKEDLSTVFQQCSNSVPTETQQRSNNVPPKTQQEVSECSTSVEHCSNPIPFPLPNPLPKPKDNTPSIPQGGGKDKKSDSDFESFWKAYPKKKSKANAEKAWKKMKPDKELVGKIMTKLDVLKRSYEWTKEEGQYIPYPASWLRAEGWNDEVEIDVVSTTPKYNTAAKVEEILARGVEF